MGYGNLLPVFLLYLFFSSSQVELARITSLIIPKWVQNGTEDQVILDCDYDFDAQLDQNLTIKWYFNEKTELIYEWIPRLDFRYVSGKLQGKFNWDFSVFSLSKDAAYKKYRALAIKTPTTELTGRYICQVVSALGDDSEAESMIVYAPPEEIEFTVVPLRNEKSIQLEYKVKRVYPMPRIQIYQTCQSSDRKQSLSNSDAGEHEKEDEQIAESTETPRPSSHNENTGDNNNIDDDNDDSDESTRRTQKEQVGESDHISYERERSINVKRNSINNLEEAPVLTETTVITRREEPPEDIVHDHADGSINNNSQSASNIARGKNVSNHPIHDGEAVNKIKRITHRTDKTLATLSHQVEPVHHTVLVHRESALPSKSNLRDDYGDDDETLNAEWREEEQEESEKLTVRKDERDDVSNTLNDAIEAGGDKMKASLWSPSVHHHKHYRNRQSDFHSVDLHRKSQVSRGNSLSRQLEELQGTSRDRRKENGETVTKRLQDELGEEDEEEKAVQVARKYIAKRKWKREEMKRQGRGGGEGGEMHQLKGQRDKRKAGRLFFPSGQENGEEQLSSAFDALNDAHQVHLSPSCDTPFSSHTQVDMKKGRRNHVTSNAEEEGEDDTDTDTHTDEKGEDETLRGEDRELQVFSSDISDDDASDLSTNTLDTSPWNNGQSTSSNSDGTLTLQYVQFFKLHQIMSNHRSVCTTLNEPVIFQLQASIPGTDFVVKKSVEYTLPRRDRRDSEPKQRKMRNFTR